MAISLPRLLALLVLVEYLFTMSSCTVSVCCRKCIMMRRKLRKSVVSRTNVEIMSQNNVRRGVVGDMTVLVIVVVCMLLGFASLLAMPLFETELSLLEILLLALLFTPPLSIVDASGAQSCLKLEWKIHAFKKVTFDCCMSKKSNYKRTCRCPGTVLKCT